MPAGRGTYGSQVGRPSKKDKARRRAGLRGSPITPVKKFRKGK